MSNKDEIPYLRKGMSGRPTRTLVEFAAGLAHNGWATEHKSIYELRINIVKKKDVEMYMHTDIAMSENHKLIRWDTFVHLLLHILT